MRTHLQDLAEDAGRSYFGPRTPKPGTISYQDSWQLTANVASHDLSDSAGIVHWDVFISHAGEDKEDFVRPLAGALRARGLSV